MDMFRLDRLTKWRMRSISPTSGNGGGASARQLGRQQGFDRRPPARRTAATDACAGRVGSFRTAVPLPDSLACCNLSPWFLGGERFPIVDAGDFMGGWIISNRAESA